MRVLKAVTSPFGGSEDSLNDVDQFGRTNSVVVSETSSGGFVLAVSQWSRLPAKFGRVMFPILRISVPGIQNPLGPSASLLSDSGCRTGRGSVCV